MVDITLLINAVNDISILQLGSEIIALGVALVLAILFAPKKRDTAIMLPIIYAILFLIGWATQVWIVIVLALAGGWYRITTRDTPDYS